MSSSSPVRKRDVAARSTKLTAEIAELQAKLGEGINAEKIVKRHIQLLHEYNESKDAAQILIGKLAAMRQVTIRELHDDFGIAADD